MADVKNNVSSIQQTQPIDSLPSDSGEGKDGWIGKFGDELAIMQDTERFEDDTWIDDQYVETQVMDIDSHNHDFLLCGETQALDLVFDSQEEPLVEEKRLVEPFDCLPTQVLDHCNDEFVADSDDEATDVLEDHREQIDCGDSHSKALSEDNRQLAGEKIESTCAREAQANKSVISGKVARFASVRSAAFRASAVAARLATQKLPNSNDLTLVKSHLSGQMATLNSSLEYSVGEVRDQQCPLSISVEKKDGLRTGSRTARKLFLDDLPEENDCSVNLSYIDSQEPGEASQASALNLVDKLISESCLELAPEVEADFGRRTEEKTKLVPIKGPQDLAKKASYKSGTDRNGVFDWDDNREDEGGGDIYCRRKEEFFGIARKARECSTLPREQKSELIQENHRELAVAVNQRRAHSDSRLLQRSVTRSQKKIKPPKKNLGKEFDEVSEDRSNKVVILGNDTQVAAEAIDALCSGGRKFDAEASCLTGKKLSPGEERGFTKGGVITRQSKGTKRIQAMGNDELLKRRMKKASPILAKGCGKNIERSLKGNRLDKQGPCCSKRNKVQTTSRETRKSRVGDLDEVSTESNTRLFDRHEEAEAGPDTQMAVEAINALRSGDGREINSETNCLLGEKLSAEAGISSLGVTTRKSKRFKGIQAMDNDVELLKRKTKKARSVLGGACEKNMETDKPDMADEVVLSTTEKRLGELSKNNCTSRQPRIGEAVVLSYPKRRRSARISPGRVDEAGRSSTPAFDTPVKSKTLVKSRTASKIVSPICMGDEYHRLSCKDSFTSNTTREFLSLTSALVEPIIPETKITRKRRDLGSICVLFSQHLDEDVTKHLKKIMARLDISEASSMKEATHFIANSFMRTRNMLEAIASGKPIVTTQWIESIDQVNIYVDEGPYILRDSKKEKEFSFNMEVSLARARQYPLLQGRKVFITPNTNPGLNTITTLVKAVHGLPIERLGRSALSEDRVPENLLVLSCEEDRDISKPFLERGGEVYSSELLLNGIVTQKLEYERYRLFTDHVRRTRSTIWIRDGKGDFKRRRSG